MLSKGQQPYTPSRVEWLALQLNSKNQITCPRLNGIILLYLAIPEEDLLRVAVSHPKDAEQSIVREVVESGKHIASAEAQIYGWDSWIKIEEFVQEQEQEFEYPIARIQIQQ